tara:strand:+ start:31 stop:420 length:390 start_codon:yes stop_codon:yes gene_type:complete
MFFTYNSNICNKCVSKIPNLSSFNKTSYNNSSESKKMLLAKRIRSNGKINSNTKTKRKLIIYEILFKRDYDEIKNLLFKIGRRQTEYYVNGLTCSQNSKSLTLEILVLYNSIIENLDEDEIITLNNICP